MTTNSPTPAQVAEAQKQLRALGHDTSGDETGVIGSATTVAVEAFQHQRGLPVTGILDLETRQRIEEAGWQLGSRLLFVTRPHLRGDDVAVLQEKLALLGFDPGRIDGIFGVMTEHAVSDFQSNCGLEPSGVLTRATFQELNRLSARSAGRRPVTEARDHAGLRAAHHSGVIVVHGSGHFPANLAAALSENFDVTFTDSREDLESTALANNIGAALLIAVTEQTDESVEIHYFASYRSRSVLGEQLATSIAAGVRPKMQPPVSVRGMSLPILRETFMPALHLAVGPLSLDTLEALTSTIVASVDHVLNSAR